jgi:peptide/nickel transport system permease protein
LQVVSAVGFAVPNFLVAMYLVVVFAVRLRWVPATGYTPLGESFTGWLNSIVLPVTALSIAATAAVAQQTRNAAVAVLATDYFRTLRSRGLPRRRLFLRHVLRNSSSAALTILSLQFIGLLGGAVIIEYIFALPGLGSYAVGASTQKDLPAVQGLVVVTVAIVVLVNLLADVAQAWLNPRLRAS